MEHYLWQFESRGMNSSRTYVIIVQYPFPAAPQPPHHQRRLHADGIERGDEMSE